MQVIPQEICQYIFSLTEAKDCAMFRLVCKSWKTLIDSETIWGSYKYIVINPFTVNVKSLEWMQIVGLLKHDDICSLLIVTSGHSNLDVVMWLINACDINGYSSSNIFTKVISTA